MSERALQVPPPGVLFLIFFAYATAAALIFQNLLLPMTSVPYHGQGLVQGDSAYFHSVAVKLAERIRGEGWSVWQIYPGQGASGNVALLAALYVFFGDSPSLMVPINAVIHAITGVLFYFLGRTLWPGRVGKLAGLLTATLFVAFPSTLNWYGQIHKDGFAIMGSTLLALAWLRIDGRPLFFKHAAGTLLMTLAGITLIMFVRPYSLKIVLFGTLVMFVIGVLARFRRHGSIRGLALKAAMMAAMVLAIAFTPKQSYDSDRLYTEWDSKSLVTGEGASRLGEYAAPILAWEWKRSEWLPAWLDGYAEGVARTRVGLITVGLYEGARSIYDVETLPVSAPELIAYMPRALQVSLFAPFPSTWFEKVSIPRLVAAGEMAIWYLIAPGILLALWYRRSPALWSVVVLAISALLIYGTALGNLGTLHRLRYFSLMLLMLLGALGWFRFFELRGWLVRAGDGKNGQPSSPQLFSHVEETHAARKGLLTSGLTVSAVTAISFIGLFFRDVLMARMFGLGSELDAFVAGTIVPMFLVAAFSVPLGTAIVPIFLAERQRSSLEGACAVVGSIGWMFLAAASVTAIFFAALGPLLLELAGWTLMPDKIALVNEVSRWLLAIFVVSGLLTLANGVLNAVGYYFVPSTAQAVVPVIAILALWVFGDVHGVVVVAIAMFIGQLFNLLIVHWTLVAAGARIFGSVMRPVWLGTGFLKQYFPLVAAAIFMQMGPPLGTAIASALPEGSVAALGLGSKAVLFITGLTGAAITSVVLPYFAGHLAQNKLLHARRELSFLLLAGTVVSIPIALLLHLMALPFVQIIFEGGAFGRAESDLVARVMAYGVLQLPFFVVNLLLLKFAIATRGSGRVMLASLAGLCIGIMFSVVLMDRMGAPGIALAMTVAAAGSAILMLLLFCRLGDVAWVDLVFIGANWGLFLTAMVCLHYHSYAGAAAAIFAYAILMLGEWRSIRESVRR